MTNETNTTIEELFESLTGFDEIAITQHFGASPEDLKGTLLGRALLFILRRREGSNDVDAFKDAMSMTVADLTNLFLPEGDEEAGKESPLTAPSLAALPPSA